MTGFELIDEEEVMLPEVMKIMGLKEYFTSESYAASFKKVKFILAYNILKRVYQVALGEPAKRFTLDKKLLAGMDFYFRNMPVELYEKFDNMLAEKFFIDFKLWKGRFAPLTKLRTSDARKVLYVNIIKPYGKKVQPYLEAINEPILSIPYLYDPQDNSWNIEGLKKIISHCIG